MRVLYGFLLGLGSAVPGLGQSFTPSNIVFEGAPEYRQEQLLAATGLTPGKPVTQAQLDEATQRLGDQGIFSDVNYQTSGLTLTFSLKPVDAAQMQAVEFANFPMFQPAELLAGVEKGVPLFNGKVPSASPMQQRVERALESMLKDRGITARVDSIRTQTGKLDYSIANPPVKVSALDVVGADWSHMPALKEVRDRVVGSDYTEEFSGDGLRRNLLDAYRDMGYMDAAVMDVAHGSAQVEADRIAVPIVAKADPGPVYTVTRVELSSAVAGIRTEEIAAANLLKVGAPASRVLVLGTSARLKSVYVGHGYLDATTSVDPAKDTTAHTLAYSFHAAPGEIYRMRALGVRGLTEVQARSAKTAWKLDTGAIFEHGLLLAFQQNGAAAKLCEGKPVEVSVAPEHAAHVVDVLLSCPGSFSTGNE